MVALPLYELVWSTARRIVRGVSPFQADTDHFHHLLLKAGFGVRGAFLAFVSLTMIFAGIGLGFDHFRVSDSASFLVLVVFGIMTTLMMYRARLIWLLVPKTMSRFELPRVAEASAYEQLSKGLSIPGLAAADRFESSNGPAEFGASVLQGHESVARDRKPPPTHPLA